MPKVNLDGVGIYYEVHGEGQRLMLVHGAFASHTMWKYQVEALSESTRVIACYLRATARVTKGIRAPTR